jgi:hypothetical protein
VAGRHAAPEARLEWQTRRGRALRTLGMDPCQLLLGCRRDGLSDRRRRRPGQEPDRRLPAAYGKCLPGSEPREVWMVRRRSTVRFRKGAPRSGGFFVYLSEDHFRCREKVWRSTRKQNPRSEPVCRCLTDVGQFQSGGKISTITTLTGSFALARERPPSGVQ